MSTIDPLAARAERDARRLGSPVARAATIASAALLAIGAASLGLAWSSLAEADALRATTQSGFDLPTRLPDATILIMIGVAGLIAGSTLYTVWNRRWSGRSRGRQLAVVGVVPIAAVALALGVGAGSLLWAAPDEIGQSMHPQWGDVVIWGAGEWIAYWSRLWLPAAVALAAIACVVVAIVSRRRGRERDGRLERLLVTGRRAEGVVTQGGPFERASARYLLRIGVRFDDHLGTTRWVRRDGAFLAEEVPLEGEAMQVLFDPEDPGDTSGIFLAVTSRSGDVRWI